MLILASSSLAACSDDEPTPERSPFQAQDEIFTLGILSDITGPASTSLVVIDAALKDLIDYYNDNDLIPGVYLEVITYDTQYSPSNAIPGYEWLKMKGADLIISWLPQVTVTIYPQATDDGMVVFSSTAEPETIVPPTTTFALNVPTSSFAFTLMKWIAENDWDHQSNGPAKIGMTGWQTTYSYELLDGIEAYCTAHPDQFQLVGGSLTALGTMDWGPEVNILKDCDYVFPPATGVSTTTFMKEYLNADGKGKFLGTDAQSSFIGLMLDTFGDWKPFDGMLICQPHRWYNETGDVTDLMNELLDKYHSEKEAAKYRRMGQSYTGSFHSLHAMLQIIRETADRVGPEHVSSATIHDTAISFTMDFDNGQKIEYTEDKRFAWKSFGIYRASAADESMVRIDPRWEPIRFDP